MQKIVAYRNIKSKFYTQDVKGKKALVLNLLHSIVIDEKTNFLACDNTTGDAHIGQFEYLEDCLNWLENNLK